MSSKRAKRNSNSFKSKQRKKNFIRKMRNKRLALIEKEKEIANG